MRFITPPTRRDMPKPQLLKSVARRATMWKAVLLLALTVVLVFAGLRDRENPVYPGVQIYSKSTGEICSAGIPVYPQSGGSLGFIIASHCTDPSGPGNNVYQPIFSWGGDNNWAGFSIDHGTDDAYYEPDRSKPDAAIWVVANRGVSGKVPHRRVNQSGVENHIRHIKPRVKLYKNVISHVTRHRTAAGPSSRQQHHRHKQHRQRRRF